MKLHIYYVKWGKEYVVSKLVYRSPTSLSQESDTNKDTIVLQLISVSAFGQLFWFWTVDDKHVLSSLIITLAILFMFCSYPESINSLTNTPIHTLVYETSMFSYLPMCAAHVCIILPKENHNITR